MSAIYKGEDALFPVAVFHQDVLFPFDSFYLGGI